MAQPRDAPPNQYIVVQYSRAPAAPPDAYERLKHECLRGEEAATLLDKLCKFIEKSEDKLKQTVNNYTQQMLLSAVRVSETQCPKLQATLTRARRRKSRQ